MNFSAFCAVDGCRRVDAVDVVLAAVAVAVAVAVLAAVAVAVAVTVMRRSKPMMMRSTWAGPPPPQACPALLEVKCCPRRRL